MQTAQIYLQAIAPIPPVPSRVCVYKSTQTTTTDENTTTWTDVDIGTAHQKRVVILAAYHGVAATATATVNGIPAYHSVTVNAFSMHAVLVPNGTTAAIAVTATSSLRKAVSVYIVYPETHLYIDVRTATATGTNDAVASNVDVIAGGSLVYIGGQPSTLGAFTTTWSGPDAVTEDVDAQIEAAASYTTGHISPISVSSMEDDLTLAETVSGVKAVAVLTFGPPPLRSN